MIKRSHSSRQTEGRASIQGAGLTASRLMVFDAVFAIRCKQVGRNGDCLELVGRVWSRVGGA